MVVQCHEYTKGHWIACFLLLKGGFYGTELYLSKAVLYISDGTHLLFMN